MIHGQAFGKPKTITTLIYRVAFDEPEDTKSKIWIKGQYHLKISLLSDGSFFIEKIKNKLYIGYSPIAKKYYFIDLKKKNKKEIKTEMHGHYSVKSKKVRKCGVSYTIKSNESMDNTTMDICIKEFKLGSKFKPLVKYMVPGSLNIPLDENKVYLTTKLMVRDKNIVWTDSSLIGRSSKQLFPHDPKVLFGYKTLPGKCHDFRCGRNREINKIIQAKAKRYKKN